MYIIRHDNLLEVKEIKANLDEAYEYLRSQGVPGELLLKEALEEMSIDEYWTLDNEEEGHYFTISREELH
jgi:hypothetical protein